MTDHPGLPPLPSPSSELSDDFLESIGNLERLHAAYGRQLPLLLEVDQQTTLLRFMTGDEDYRSTVQSLLAEMVQVLLSVGQTGFRYLEQEATPTLLLTEETFAWLQSDYQPAPFRQCLPYLQVQV